uniref:HECT-type E3 ubiquitin transferase n=1 Tax=Vannella robusta TaxID=1487602 RepID=A0A6U1XBC0_9EUKA|mmetsp:Transcript_716/g.889  ORF Transcript_716/g.889 Transcript_716/m.889 type:complete len:109 (+) Transcript_716:630-956(+)
MKQFTDVSGFTPSSKEVKWFWTAMGSLTSFERKKLLQFITGSSSVPPDGFQAMKPKLCIVKSNSTKDSLPTSHTCFNRIDLPAYSSYAVLQEKLLVAVNEGYKGFALL